MYVPRAIGNILVCGGGGGGSRVGMEWTEHGV